MVYLATIFLIILVIKAIKRPNSNISLYIFGAICGWCLSLLGFLQYLAKLNQYYIIAEYFYYFPSTGWMEFIYSGNDIMTVIRYINFGTILFMGCIYVYMISLLYDYKKPKVIIYLPWLLLLIQVILYDPAVYQNIYKVLLNTTSLNIGYEGFNRFYEWFYFCSRTFNIGLLLVPLGCILYRFYKRRNLPIIREFYLLNTICLSSIIIMYLIAFSWSPAVLVSVYQRTTYLIYEQPNFNPSAIYTIYPYLCIITFILLIWSSLKYKSSKRMMTSKYLSKENRLKKNNLGMRAFSHGLKNQLLAIQFESELLIDELDDNNKELKESAETIYAITKETIKNLNQVHKRMQTQSIILEATKINNFLQDFIIEEKNHLPEKILLQHKLCHGKPISFLDEEHLKECLKIIIKNAIDAFEGEGGKITILSEVINEWVILSIKDNGIGMDELTKQNVFDPFYTTKTGDHNWGIGLYYVRQIVEAHNGNVVVDSEKGKGTEVRILLPAVI